MRVVQLARHEVAVALARRPAARDARSRAPGPGGHRRGRDGRHRPGRRGWPRGPPQPGRRAPAGGQRGGRGRAPVRRRPGLRGGRRPRRRGLPAGPVIAGGEAIAYRETAVRGAAGAAVRVAGSYASTAGGADGRPGDGDPARHQRGPGPRGAARGLRGHGQPRAATPLALIRGYAETLLHLDLDADQQRAYVERIDEASSRLTALVDQVLDVTHLQADPLILDRTRRPSPRSSPGCAATCHRRRRGSPRRSPLPDDLPDLEVDVARVGQVLSNLVGNALKYAPAHGPVVIGATVDGRRGSAVTVDDEGVGVPESDRTLVTEPFHRAWNVRESRIPGTGLGLFICRRLVEAHGGTLTVGDRPTAEPGRGSASRCRWPTVGPTVADTVLIVEDEPEFAGPRRSCGSARPATGRHGPDRARTPCAASTTSDPTSSSSTSRCPVSMAGSSSSGSASSAGCRSSWSPRAARRRTRSAASSSAPTTTSPSRCRSRSSWRGSRRPCAAPRRARPSGRASLRHRDLVVDLDDHRAHLHGIEVALTPTEFRLLAYLVEHAGQLVTHRPVLARCGAAATTATSTCCG